MIANTDGGSNALRDNAIINIDDNSADRQAGPATIEKTPHLDSKGYCSEEVSEEEAHVVQNHDHRGSRFVLHTENPFRRMWSWIVVILLIYTGTVFLYTLSFVRCYANGELTVAPFWSAFDQLMDIMFTVDLFLYFFFSYKDQHGNEVDSMYKIAAQYLRGWFIINLLSVIPDWLLDGIIGLLVNQQVETYEAHQSLRMSRLNRITRLARMLRLVKLTQITGRTGIAKYIRKYKLAAVLKTFISLFFVVHLMACGWYLCAALHEDPLDTWLARRTAGGMMLLFREPLEQWIHAIYFIFTVFSTVGFGDISPATTGEMLYVVLTMMVGAVIHSIIIGQVITEVTTDNETVAFLKAKLQLAQSFADHAKLSGTCRDQLTGWIEHNVTDLALNQKQNSRDEIHQLIACDMPVQMMQDMHQQLFNGKLIRNKLLSCSVFAPVRPPRLPLMLANVLTPKSFQFSQHVYQTGEAAFHLFLVLTGTFAFVDRPSRDSSNANARPSTGSNAKARTELWPYQFFCHNSYFGDFELQVVSKPVRRATVRVESQEGGTVLRLHRDDFARLCFEFPQFAAAWRTQALQRESQRLRLLAIHHRALPYRQLAVRRMQRFVRGCLRAARSRSCGTIPPAVKSTAHENGQDSFGVFSLANGTPLLSRGSGGWTSSATEQAARRASERLAKEQQEAQVIRHQQTMASISSLRCDFDRTLATHAEQTAGELNALRSELASASIQQADAFNVLRDEIKVLMSALSTRPEHCTANERLEL